MDHVIFFWLGWGASYVELEFFFPFCVIAIFFSALPCAVSPLPCCACIVFSTVAVKNPVNADYFRKYVYVCRLGVQEFFW